MRFPLLCGISVRFQTLSPATRQISHALLTRSPLFILVQVPRFVARLACIRHAASVRPEPGSNSHLKFTSSNELAVVCLSLLNWQVYTRGLPLAYSHSTLFSFQWSIILTRPSLATTIIFYQTTYKLSRINFPFPLIFLYAFGYPRRCHVCKLLKKSNTAVFDLLFFIFYLQDKPSKWKYQPDSLLKYDSLVLRFQDLFSWIFVALLSQYCPRHPNSYF